MVCVFVVMQALPLVFPLPSAPDFGSAAAAWTASGGAPSTLGSVVFGQHLSSQVGTICPAFVRTLTYIHCIYGILYNSELLSGQSFVNFSVAVILIIL